MILEDTFVVNVQVALFSGDHILLIKRSKTETHAPGAVDLPGGKLELGELGNDALERLGKRELLEETGIEAAAGLRYICSALFVASDGAPVINVVLGVKHRASSRPPPRPGVDELDALWAPVDWALHAPEVPPWTRDYIHRAQTALRVPT
ncbi:MAG: hypothetical protein DI563_00065 [Variovorax paradoxus]|uniref:Nudix hydrolase domain-containing protein n=1 Tax=Variovorax paradoxus TaxID=34073 RepID=A0A2W5SFR4_VARPD|nr:MAG: hypothetical protein DI563_00065 [Variovorax paradoxus]